MVNINEHKINLTTIHEYSSSKIKMLNFIIQNKVNFEGKKLYSNYQTNV